MNYKDLIKDYHAKGFVSEKRMWEAVQAIDSAMACLKEKSPEVYDRSMRALHVSFCGPHYNEAFACEDVSCLFHKNRKGNREKRALEHGAGIERRQRLSHTWKRYSLRHIRRP